MPDCKICESRKWEDMYETAQKRFDRVVNTLTVWFVILVVAVIFCLITTVCALIRTQRFINQFEYVEETEIQIEQDVQGHNTVILPQGDEVKTNGAEVHSEKEMVLEKENQIKYNTILINE